MPNPISSAAKAVLAQNPTSLIKVLEIIAHPQNANLRATLDVTARVLRWGPVGGDSTLVAESWEKPGAVPVLAMLDDNLLTPGHPSSFWVANAIEPTQCWIEIRWLVPFPTGGTETIKTYRGLITDFDANINEEVGEISLTTVHPSHSGFSAQTAKTSGDDSVYLGDTW